MLKQTTWGLVSLLLISACTTAPVLTESKADFSLSAKKTEKPFADKPKGKPSGKPGQDKPDKPNPKPSKTGKPEPTSAPSSEPSPWPSASPTPEPTPVASPSATTSANPTPVASPSATTSANPTPTPLPSPTPTVTPSPSPTSSPSVSPTPTITPTPTPTPTPVPSPTATPPSNPEAADLGLNGSLHHSVFPADNSWHQPVDHLPVDENSDNLIASIGLERHLHPDFGANWNGGPFGIPYIVVDSQTPAVPIHFTAYGDESDPGPYPIPEDAPIEGGPDATGDRHILVVNRDNWTLYELFYAFPNPDGSVNASSGAIFDLNSNALRPAGWTSADAAGLPILPGLVRYDEVVEKGEITHALRFTAAQTRRAYTHPARHYASSKTDPNLPPMGMRVRLQADYDISGYPEPVQVVLRALKKYGMILADNGSNWFISGTADARWDDGAMNTLKQVPGSAFEVVQMGEIITD